MTLQAHTRGRTMRAPRRRRRQKRKTTHLRLARLGAVEREDDLLELYGRAVVRRLREPRALTDGCPGAVVEDCVCGAGCGGEGWRQEGRLLDCGEDVEVGEGGEDEGADDGLYRAVGGALCEGPEEGAHRRQKKYGATCACVEGAVSRRGGGGTAGRRGMVVREKRDVLFTRSPPSSSGMPATHAQTV